MAEWCELFENVDGNWAQDNMEAAMCFFTQGYIPFAAAADLGFPIDAVLPENGALPPLASNGSN